MARSVKKGPFIDEKLLKKILEYKIGNNRKIDAKPAQSPTHIRVDERIIIDGFQNTQFKNAGIDFVLIGAYQVV
ncbi:MAG TPA: hypothetical protein EYN59_07590, partial [Candidatus Marinimicrobia bacterium]|nr:hypothetical protein [Candidatus Neomarinimicrobiota bacterium]